MTTSSTDTARLREAWDTLAEDYDRFVAPLTGALADELVARADLGPGRRCLDVAAGTGAVSLRAARAGAEVVAVDHSPKMVERLQANARAEGSSNLDGRVMDGQDLALPDDAFDVAVSNQGVSLFPDVDRGLSEMVRVTRPGGSVLVSVFGPFHRAEPFGFLTAAMRAVIAGFTPPETPPLPFQLADRDVLRHKLAAAGLSAVAVETTSWDMAFDSATAFWSAFSSANPAWKQMTAALTDEQRFNVQHVLGGMFRERAGSGPRAVLHTEVNIGTGTK
jgi:ubiquinone/menaquinone biosynthesis C-methylase UbiE